MSLFRRNRKPHEDEPRGFADWADVDGEVIMETDNCCPACGHEMVLMCPVDHSPLDDDAHNVEDDSER